MGWRDWFNRNNDDAYTDIIENYKNIITAQSSELKEARTIAYVHQMRVMSLLGLLQDVSETLVTIADVHIEKKVFSPDQMKELVTYMAVTTTDIIQHNKQYNKRTDPLGGIDGTKKKI